MILIPEALPSFPIVVIHHLPECISKEIEVEIPSGWTCTHHEKDGIVSICMDDGSVPRSRDETGKTILPVVSLGREGIHVGLQVLAALPGPVKWTLPVLGESNLMDVINEHDFLRGQLPIGSKQQHFCDGRVVVHRTRYVQYNFNKVPGVLGVGYIALANLGNPGLSLHRNVRGTLGPEGQHSRAMPSLLLFSVGRIVS